jgi:NAD(P)-dependent dehydrogenase (short-subunit alcohol dehydrogenase family)
MDLKGSVAIITGGARGIGRAVAEAYARQNANIALVDVLNEELEETARFLHAIGANVQATKADVSHPGQVEEMVKYVENELGPVDILVTCAGILKTICPTWEADPQVWQSEMMVNLFGNFLCCRAVAKRMVKRRHGYILCMVGGGVSDPHPYSLGYACSKSGVMRLVEGLAAELKDYGVKVFALQPAATRTGMTEHILNSPEGKKWRPLFHKVFDENQDAPPEQLAALAVHLVSGLADPLTGRYFNAQWDFSEVIARTDLILQHDWLTLRIRDTAEFPVY